MSCFLCCADMQENKEQLSLLLKKAEYKELGENYVIESIFN